jgi:hypothetical protein
MLFTGNAALQELHSIPEESDAGRLCSMRINNSQKGQRQSYLKIDV